VFVNCVINSSEGDAKREKETKKERKITHEIPFIVTRCLGKDETEAEKRNRGEVGRKEGREEGREEGRVCLNKLNYNMHDDINLIYNQWIDHN